MDTTGNVLFFGSLALVAALFGGGMFVSGNLGWVIVGAGIIGLLIWAIFWLRIIAAMNSDI